MRVLLTGATGFVGRHIFNRIHAGGNEILSVIRDDKYAPMLTNASANVIVGDLRDLPGIQPAIKTFQPEVCIHAAWQGIPDFSESMCRANLYSSLEFLGTIMNETKCRKVIVSGSCFEYGKTIGACRESDRVDTPSFFVWAKQSLCAYTALLCRQRKVDFIWFRIYYIYGPGQRKESLIPSLVHAFKNNATPTILNPYNSNDFVYVEDVADAFAAATNKNVEPGIYNLGSGKATSVIEVCETVERLISGNTATSDAIRHSAGSLSATVNFWSDNRKTAEALDWTPTTNLEMGIQKYISAVKG